jgi:hypothetical protein
VDRVTLLSASDVSGAVDEAVGKLSLVEAATAQHEAGGGAALCAGDEAHVGIAATGRFQCSYGLFVQLAGGLQASHLLEGFESLRRGRVQGPRGYSGGEVFLHLFEFRVLIAQRCLRECKLELHG